MGMDGEPIARVICLDRSQVVRKGWSTRVQLSYLASQFSWILARLYSKQIERAANNVRNIGHSHAITL